MEEALGTEHPRTLHVMHSAGLLAAALEAHAEAAACFAAALEGRTRTLGADHFDTIRSAVARGHALVELRAYVEAEALLEVSLRARTIQSPPQAPQRPADEPLPMSR